MRQRLETGQTWLIGQRLVLVVGFGRVWEKGIKLVEVLPLDGPMAGRRVELANGSFAEPNRRVA